jgi:hypothetical protein
MKWIVEVLDKFTPKERIVVLVLLLTFTSFIYMGTNYFNSDKYDLLNQQYEELSLKYIYLLNTDSCAPLREQNIKLLNEFVLVSNIISTYRDLLNQSNTISIVSPMISYESRSDTVVQVSPSIGYIETNGDVLMLELLNTLESLVNNVNGENE